MSEIVYLVEVTVYDDALPGTKVLRYCTGRGTVTGPAETPANAFYEPRVINPGHLRRYMFGQARTMGRSEIGYGVVELLNSDGGLDALIDYGFDGRNITIRRGEAGAAYPGGFTTMISATMEQAEFTWDRVTIRLRDRLGEVVNKAVQPIKYTGAAGATAVEGTEDKAGLPKPVHYGGSVFVRPVLVNQSLLVYQVNSRDSAAQAGVPVTLVYDRGVALATPATSRASLNALMTTTPTTAFDYYNGVEGQFIRLKDAPDGPVSVDNLHASDPDARLDLLMKQVLTDAGGLADGDFDAASLLELSRDFPFALVSGDQRNRCAYAADLNEDTVGAAVDFLASTANVAWYLDRAGLFHFAMLKAPGGTIANAPAPLVARDADFTGGFDEVSEIPLDVPDDASIGEILVVQLALNEARTLLTPTGWTQAAQVNPAGGPTLGLFWRAVDGAEAASYDFAWTGGTSFAAGQIIRVRGADTVNPFAATPAANSGVGTTATNSSVTTVRDDSLVLGLMAHNIWDTFSRPADYQAFFGAFIKDDGDFVVADAGCKLEAAAGASGSDAWTINSSKNWATITAAISPPDHVVATLADADMLPGIERIAGDNPGNGLPVYKVVHKGRRNYFIHGESDFAGSVTQFVRQAFMAEYYENLEVEDAAVLTKHPSAPQLVLETAYVSGTLPHVAQHILDLYSPDRDFFRLPAPMATALGLDLNKVIELRIARFGMGAGRLFRVMGIEEDYATETAILEVWG